MIQMIVLLFVISICKGREFCLDQLKIRANKRNNNIISIGCRKLFGRSLAHRQGIPGMLCAKQQNCVLL